MATDTAESVPLDGALHGRTVELRGNILRLFQAIVGYQGAPRQAEFLLHGPAGTGKSLGDMYIFYILCEALPGIRLIVVRKTRKALSESWCVPFEQIVCGGHEPWMKSGVLPESRVRYRWDNGSEIVLAGLDNPDNLFSTEYDGVLVQEAFQVPESAIDRCYRQIRRFHHALNFIILETNPRHRYHPLNLRRQRGRSHDLPTFHRDNPKYYDADGNVTAEGAPYIEDLQALTGNLKLWLCLGLWEGAEGLIYPNWSEEKNVIDAPPLIPGTRMRDWRQLGISYFVAGIDWGYRDPGCLSVWGIAESGHSGIPNSMIRVAEWYRRAWSNEQWLERCVQAYHEFQPMRRFVCDPARNDQILALNTRLGSEGVPGSRRGEVPKFAIGADNSLVRSRAGDMSGIDLVRQLIGENPLVRPGLVIVRDSLREPDLALKEESRPYCLETEVYGYCYEDPVEGKIPTPGMLEHPAKSCDGKDNALDVARYIANFSFGRNLHAYVEHARYRPGTAGHLFRDWEVDGPEDATAAARKRALNRAGLQDGV